MKRMIRTALSALPTPLGNVLYRLRYRMRRPQLFQALEDYTYTDERLKLVHILEAMNYLRVAGAGGAIPPVYFEFGCHSGRTFSAAVRAARFLGMEDARFYAFDSFEGLPPTDPEQDGFFRAGAYATSRAAFERIVERNTGWRPTPEYVVQGFYNDSLTPQLQARMPKAGVIHIDVDLYSSTVDVLRFVKPLLTIGTVLIFDDWYAFPPGANKGEMRALQEFCAAHPAFAIEPWKAYSTFGKSFFITALPDA